MPKKQTKKSKEKLLNIPEYLFLSYDDIDHLKYQVSYLQSLVKEMEDTKEEKQSKENDIHNILEYLSALQDSLQELKVHILYIETLIENINKDSTDVPTFSDESTTYPGNIQVDIHFVDN